MRAEAFVMGFLVGILIMMAAAFFVDRAQKAETINMEVINDN